MMSKADAAAEIALDVAWAMTDTELLNAITAHAIWIHPAGRGSSGWTATSGGFMAWNRPTLRDAVQSVIRQIMYAQERELP